MAGSDMPPPIVPGYTPRPQVRFEVIGEAWRLVQQQMGVWIAATLLCGLIVIGMIVVIFLIMGASLIPTIMQGDGARGPSLSALSGPIILILILLTVVGAVLSGGMFRMATRQVRGEQIAVGDLFSVSDVFGPLVIVSVIAATADQIGNRLCLLPGLAIHTLWLLAIPIVVDQRLDAIAALRASWMAMKTDFWMGLLFWIVMIILMVISAIPCGLGILVTSPLYFVAVSLIYRDFFLSSSPPPAGAPGVPPTV